MTTDVPAQDAPERPPLTIHDIAQRACTCQDASNLSGLVHSWHAWLPVIREHANAIGVPPNIHPVNVLMANKISSLAHADSASEFGRAYDECQVLAQGTRS